MKTKIRFGIISIMLGISSLLIVSSCTKNDELTEDATIPVLTTKEVSNITPTTATCGGNITDAGGLNISERGVCWSTTVNPTILDNKTNDGTGIGNFVSEIAGLTTITTYHLRAYATNSAGTGYGNDIIIKTIHWPIVFNPSLSYITITDIDGNTYKTITIGTQTWMAENLKTTKYNDGTTIPNITNFNEWESLSTGAYCNYRNDTTEGSIHGRLYNWYAVNTGKLCPVGWHVPSDAEWTTLTDYLGGATDAGNLLKEIGSYHWGNENANATNSSGFTGIPGGVRSNGLDYFYISNSGYWWSSTQSSVPNNATGRYMVSALNFMNITTNYKSGGLSVRCVMN